MTTNNCTPINTEYMAHNKSPHSISKEKRILNNLHKTVSKHPVLTHEYLQRMETADFPDIHFALKDFAQYAYSRHFRVYVGIVLSKLKHEKHRALLMHNIEEENGILHEDDLQKLEQHGIKSAWVNGVPHVQLGNRLRHSLGIQVGDQSFSQAVTGCTIEEATYRAIFFERTARMQLLAMSTGRAIKKVKKEKGEEARDWRSRKGPVEAHFNYFARRVLKNHPDYS